MSGPKKQDIRSLVKPVGYLTLFFTGVSYYWFLYRPWAKHQKHLNREREAEEYWKIHNQSKEKNIE